MRGRIISWVVAPIALGLAMTGLMAGPSAAVTGPNIEEDFVHEYVGLVAFYDEEGEFIHRCSGSLLSDSVFLTAGHCVERGDGSGEVAAYARIWFEQDAGADYDPVTDTPATSGYPYTGGITSELLYNYGFTDLSGANIPQTHDVGLIVIDPDELHSVYPEVDTYAELAPVNYSITNVGTGLGAVVDVSGYGVTRINGPNGRNTLSYRERLMGSAFIIRTGGTRLTGGYNLQIASNPGGGRVGTCFGDSGGPILAGGTDIVLAVNSFVQNWSCGGQGFAYRVDTAEVQAWMEEILDEIDPALWDEIAPAA
jgi:hypothetical protein